MLLSFTIQSFQKNIYRLMSKMSNCPVRGTLSQRKSKNIDDIQAQNHLDQSLRLIDQLFEARLIDHLARPLEYKSKIEVIDKFKAKLQSLHDRLRRIARESTQKSTTDNNAGKGKSNVGSTTYRPPQWYKYIRNIQSKYSQVLIDGSFKYLAKICYLLQINHDPVGFQTINIEQWAATCLQARSVGSCC